jgi:predicted branched-subunit amino acid permease
MAVRTRSWVDSWMSAAHRLSLTPRGGAWVPFAHGFLASSPLWPFIAPFAFAFALAAQAAGLNAAETVGMSALMNAGASQLAAVALIASGADVLSILLATLVVNLRFVPLSLSLAPLLRGLSWPKRLLLAFSLSDLSYSVSLRRLQTGEAGATFLLGSGVGLYLWWVACTMAAVYFGEVLPDLQALGLHLVFPLALMALLMPSLGSRPAWMAVLMAGVLALGSRQWLPGSWCVLLAALGGSAAAAVLEGRR